MKQRKISSNYKETYIERDPEGNVIKEEINETQDNYIINDEPDYIKIYTKMWCEFNQIPERWKDLFFELITRMTYANSDNLKKSQIVATGGPTKESICETLGWERSNYQKGLRALSECGAIRKISRGFYQINPNYAGRGEWRYNKQLHRGGIKDLVATFDFRNKTIEVNTSWVDETDNKLIVYNKQKINNDNNQINGQIKLFN